MTPKEAQEYLLRYWKEAFQTKPATEVELKAIDNFFANLPKMVQGNWAPVKNVAAAPVGAVVDLSAQPPYQCKVWDGRNFRFDWIDPPLVGEFKWADACAAFIDRRGRTLTCDVCSAYAALMMYPGSPTVTKARCRQHEFGAPTALAPPVAVVRTPVVPAEPPMCWERYSGIECQCPKQHHLPGSRR